MGDKNCSLEVLLIKEEEIRFNDGRGSWRTRGVSVKDRMLLKVFDRTVFKNTQNFLEFLPKGLDEYFTNKVLALKLGISVTLAQKITYCLRKMGAIYIAGKKRNELLFNVS
jgi:hypothetical protein